MPVAPGMLRGCTRHLIPEADRSGVGVLRPDADESTRSAIGVVITKRVDSAENPALWQVSHRVSAGQRVPDSHVVVQRELGAGRLYELAALVVLQNSR